MRVLGPADVPLSLVRGRHRFRLLVKAPRAFDLSAYLREWLAHAPKKHGTIKLEVDATRRAFCSLHLSPRGEVKASRGRGV